MARKSIRSFFARIIISVIFIQALIYLSLLLFGGVLNQGKLAAYENFNEIVNNRKISLEKEIKNRWTNFDPFLVNIQEKISNPDIARENFLESITLNLIEMLRATSVTGTYVILGNPEDTSFSHESLYLVDYDPLTNTHENTDVFLKYGDAEIANKHNLALDINWAPRLKLNEENQSFFEIPYNSEEDFINPKHMGYWSEPFKLSEEDLPIITYSIPLQNREGEILGIIGIELRENYLSKFVPASELANGTSLGYLIAKKGTEDGGIYPIFMSEDIQKSFIDQDEFLDLNMVNKEKNIYLLKNSKGREKTYATYSQIDLYSHRTPHEEELYLIGFKRDDDLLHHVNKLTEILRYSVFISLVTGVVISIWGSKKMSKPVLDLVEQVLNFSGQKNLDLKPTNILELDQLSEAITHTNRLMIDSASRVSRIIEMVELPIAVFEIDKRSNKVLVTENFQSFFGENINCKLVLKSKDSFQDFLQCIKSKGEPGEKDIYKIDNNEDRWIKIKTKDFEHQIYGVIEDVTKEVLEKKKIMLERDLDPLTKILNRKKLEIEFNKWYENKNNKDAALIMFDIDDLKAINDSYGHKWGDFYIEETVKQLKKIGNPDKYILGRRSGDEFVMLLYNYNSKDEIRRLINQFYDRQKRHYLDFPRGNKINIKISSGLTWINNQDLSYEELLDIADKSMYFSKKHDRGNYSEDIRSLI